MGSSPKLKAGRPLIGLSFGGGFGGDIDNMLSTYYVPAWNSGGATGHVAESYTHYMYDGMSSWQNMTAFDFPYSQLNGMAAGTGLVVWSIQMFPTGGSYSNLLSGNYLSLYQALGARLAQYAPQDVGRLGWEGDGNWFPWGVGTSGVTYSMYRDAWGYIVPILRSEGFNGPMEFNASSDNGHDPFNFAPDPSLYDIVGNDKYFGNGDPSRATDWVYCWNTYQKPVYDHMAALAARDGKRLAFSEISTGIRYGDGVLPPGYMCGDDDYALQQFAAWVKQHDVAYINVFEGDDKFGSSGTDPFYGTHTANDIKNRFQWLVEATDGTASTVSPDLAHFPNSVAWWKSAASLGTSLAYTGSGGGSGGDTGSSSSTTAAVPGRRREVIRLHG